MLCNKIIITLKVCIKEGKSKILSILLFKLIGGSLLGLAIGIGGHESVHM